MPPLMHYFRPTGLGSGSAPRDLRAAAVVAVLVAVTNFVFVRFSGVEGIYLLIFAPFLNLACAIGAVFAKEI